MRNLISISGKKQSGKDTVGKIIQYLVDNSQVEIKNQLTFEEFKKSPYGDRSHWKIKKFASKLKEIVSLLTGCKVEDFEYEEFKNSKLSDEWEQVLRGKSKLGPEIKRAYTYREALQIIGTDLLRNKFHENIWVNATFADYKPKPISLSTNSNITITLNTKGEYSTKYPNWIFTDVRFPNELKAIKDRGGITIRVIRKPLFWNDNEWTDEMIKWNEDQHESETALDNAEFDYTIENDGSIGKLIMNVTNILIAEQIIN